MEQVYLALFFLSFSLTAAQGPGICGKWEGDPDKCSKPLYKKYCSYEHKLACLGAKPSEAPPTDAPHGGLCSKWAKAGPGKYCKPETKTSLQKFCPKLARRCGYTTTTVTTRRPRRGPTPAPTLGPTRSRHGPPRIHTPKPKTPKPFRTPAPFRPQPVPQPTRPPPAPGPGPQRPPPPPQPQPQPQPQTRPQPRPTTPRPKSYQENFLDCCRANGIPGPCLDLCRGSRRVFCNKGAHCESALKIANYCRLNAQAEQTCCQGKGLPADCNFMCRPDGFPIVSGLVRKQQCLELVKGPPEQCAKASYTSKKWSVRAWDSERWTNEVKDAVVDALNC